MENIAIIIIGALLSVLSPAGNRIDTPSFEKSLMRELGAENVSVSVENIKYSAEGCLLGKVTVQLKNWELDQGTADSVTLTFKNIRAVRKGGKWVAAETGPVELEVTFGEKNFWDAVAYAKGNVQIIALSFKKDGRIEIKEAVPLVMGIPAVLAITGRPVLEQDTMLSIGDNIETALYGYGLGGWADKYALRIVNPLIDMQEWDLTSANSQPYLEAAGGEFKLKLKSARIVREKLEVKGLLEQK